MVNLSRKRGKNGNEGCILLGLFQLFLFRFRNNRTHGISISKGTLLRSGNGITPCGGDSENYYVATGASGRVGFPAKNFPNEREFCLFRINCPELYSFHSVHSSIENGIAPKRTKIPYNPSIPIQE